MTEESQVAQSETLEQIADRISDLCPARSDGETYRRKQVRADILSALRNERERCAKVADERVAFNKRLMRTHNIGDPIADLKQTRADEAEIIAKEIRSGEEEDEGNELAAV